MSHNAMLTPGLTFEPRSHAYYLGDRKLPSVTTITGAFYAGPKAGPERLKASAERGSTIHALTDRDDRRDLTGEDLPGWLTAQSQYAGERAAWRAWRRDRRFAPTHIEARMASRLWAVAGTVDRIGVFRRPAPTPPWWRWPGSEVRGVADIKTGAIPDLCQAQLAAYRNMAVELDLVDPHCPLVAVAIRDDGSYFDFWYVGDLPDALWESAWTIYNHRPANHKFMPCGLDGYIVRPGEEV